MWLSKKTAIFGLLVTLFVVQICHSTGAKITTKIINNEKTPEEFGKLISQTSIQGVIQTAIPALAIIVPPPLGIGLSVGLSVLHGIYQYTKGSQNNLNWEAKLTEKVGHLEKQLTDQIGRSTERLMVAVESYQYLKQMREQLDSMKSEFSFNIVCILDDKCVGSTKSHLLKEISNPLSVTRKASRDFTTKYLNSKIIDLQNVHQEKFYFEFIVQKNEIDVKDDTDYYSVTYNTRIFKVYNLINEVLTKNYVLFIAAHAAQYKQANPGNPEELQTIRNSIADLSREYLDHIAVLMTKTKWAFKQTSREIRNSGKFGLTRGRTFERLNFISTRFQDYESPAWFTPCEVSDANSLAINDGFNLFNCEQILNPHLPRVYVDLLDKDRPYRYMQIREYKLVIDGQTYGRVRENNVQGKDLDPYNSKCPTEHCSAYKPRRVGICTNPISAQEGYVVTGVRWRVKNDIIFIEIREGKFIDATKVDEGTVHWVTKTIPPSSIQYLDENMREIDLVDTELPPDHYVTDLQIVVTKSRRIKLLVGGARANFSGSILKSSRVSNQNQLGNEDDFRNRKELNLDRDDPELAPENSNVYVRNRDKRFVKLQDTDFKKDLGRTTIPYFDLRDVITNPPAPIGGIGVYHQAVPGFGGFISLKMFSPDYSNMIDFGKLEKFFTAHQISIK